MKWKQMVTIPEHTNQRTKERVPALTKMVELTVNVDELFRTLGVRALKSKTGQAREAAGLIRLRVIRKEK